MIDTHAHLDDKQYDTDRAQMIARIFDSGVEKVINIGAGLGSSRRSVELAEEYKNIFASVGLHPYYFNEYGERSFDKISEFKELAKHKKVVAIGEIGLDYFSHDGNEITDAQKENQKKGFIFQLDLAKELNLPVIIHCRSSKENPADAYNDLIKILLNTKYQILNTVFHCYGGNTEFTKKLLQQDNVYFSFTGNITYAKDSAEIIEVVKMIPMEKIMLETDCPYLAPVPHRGKRNEPAFLQYICEKIAEIKQISAKEVDKITTKNAKKFFKLN